jgi:putative PEP-CTERM system TPR-repeat lipoprotein
MFKPSDLRARIAMLVAVLALLVACGAGDPDKQLASAKSYLEKGENQAAIIQLRTALQQQPDKAEARFLLGKVQLDNGDAVAAAVELRKALDLKYSPAEATPLLARAMLEQGQASLVVAQFAGATLDNKEAQARLMTTVAQAHLQLGQAPKAEAALKQALEATPGFVPAQVIMARLLAAGGDAPKALEAVEAIVAKGATDADAWALQGDLLVFTRNDREGALAAYRKALGVNPKHLPSHVAVISLLLSARDLDGAATQVAALQKARPGHPMARLFAAQVAYEKRDFKTAKEGVQQLLKAAPDHPQVNQLAAAIELASGSVSVAKSHLAKTLQAVPGNVAARRMLAAAHLRSGESAKALEALQPLLDAPTSDGMALALAGEAQMQLGELDKAGDLFARAAKANPESVETQTALARTRFLKGDTAGAVADLERISAASTGTVADLELINAQLRRRNFQGALQAIDALERKQPGKPLALQLRGAAYQGLKDTAQARANFEKALALDAAYFPAAFALARLDLADKKPQAAQARFESVLKAQPGHLQALLALAGLKERNGAQAQEVTDLLATAVRLNPSDAAAHLSLVNHHLAGKRNEAALTAAQQADAALPNQPSILDALGRAQLAAGQQNQAMATFNKILAVQPQSVGAHLRVVDANLAAKDSEAAIQSLKRAIAAQPNAPVLYQRLFVLLVQANQTGEAMKLARDLQKRQSAHSLGFVLEGDAHRASKNIDAALAAYKTALGKAMPTDAAIRYHAVLSATGKRADADKFAAGWIKDQPKDVGFASYLADITLARNDLPAAEVLYRRVIELQPDNAVALNNVAWLMVKANKPGAVAMAEQANALRPDQPALMDTLAMALAADKKLDQALELQKKALTLAPDSPVIKLGLARLYVQGGQKAQARELLEPLSQLGDKFQDHTEVKTLLSAL